MVCLSLVAFQFHRDDLYTLFITARIINFFKGLRLKGEKVSLQEALSEAENAGHREKLGAQILRKLLDERRLYAATKVGLKPVPRFNAKLFFRVMEKSNLIKTKGGVDVVSVAFLKQ